MKIYYILKLCLQSESLVGKTDLNQMHNDSIDFQNLKKVNHFNPLFQSCYKALSSSHDSRRSNSGEVTEIKKSYAYLVIKGRIDLPYKLFQCKHLCPVFVSGNQCYILVRGQNLWDYYRTKKQNQVILTEQQIWIMITQIAQALMHLIQYGFFHRHLKEYAIYRQSVDSYQLLFHPQIKSMSECYQSNDFCWQDFYLSPQQLKLNSKPGPGQTQKNCVFSFGLLILNVINPQDFNRNVYSKKRYQIDWEIVNQKLKNGRKRYSKELTSLIQKCLEEYPQQRYGFKEILNLSQNLIKKMKDINLQFKQKINDLINSNMRTSKSLRNTSLIKSPSLQEQFNDPGQKRDREPTSNQKNKYFSQQKSQDPQKYVPNYKQNYVCESPQVKKWKDNIECYMPVIIDSPIYQITKADYVNKDIRSIQMQMGEQGKLQNTLNTKQEQINFERGTFGGQIQSPTFKQFLSRKLKNQSTSQVQQKKKENEVKMQTLPYKPVEGQQFLKIKVVGLEPKNRFDQKTINSRVENMGTHEGQELNVQVTQEAQNQQVCPVKISTIVKLSVEDLKMISTQFCNSHAQLERMKLFLSQKEKQIGLALADCLQPIQVLQKAVTESLGIYIQGNIYFGSYKNGRRNGFGLQVFPQDQYYFGCFKDDLFHGQGFYYWNKNQYFSGLFQDGRKTFGHLFGPKLNYTGEFRNSKKMNGIGKATYKTGQIFTGSWKEGRKTGVGELIQITHDKFIGLWQKNKKSGYGEHISSEYPEGGYIMKAIWKNHDIVSDAIIEYSNGNIYQGSLNEFQKHGKGIYIFKKGGYYKGTFYQNQATHGELMYKNGQKYVGCLRNMKRHGFGEYFYLDGTIKKGNWIDDVRIQKDAQTKIKN